VQEAQICGMDAPIDESGMSHGMRRHIRLLGGLGVGVVAGVVAVMSCFAGTGISLAASRPAVELPAGQLAVPDAVRLAEAYRLVEEVGNEIWPGFDEVPFPVLLVTGEREYLVGWEKAAPQGFEASGVDKVLRRQVMSRPSTFPPGIEASFPAFGPPAVVVIGTAEATDRISTEWVLTVLHEHLHQLQYEAPGYYAEAEALDLARADDSGMWMLNYPFPYEDAAVGRDLAELAVALRSALVEEGGSVAVEKPWILLRRLLGRLEPADARYLSFQLWQEGIGRYVEWKAAQVAAAQLGPGAEFAALPDAVGWAEAYRTERQRIIGELESCSLAECQRVFFYSLGAALGVLLDRQSPDWKTRYLTEKFVLHKYADLEAEPAN